jgi:hypothetical protein
MASHLGKKLPKSDWTSTLVDRAAHHDYQLGYLFMPFGIYSEDDDTLTLYVGPQRSAPMIEDIRRLAPKRVIFNPGTESPELTAALDRAGIPHVEACTLVMLQTGQF